MASACFTLGEWRDAYRHGGLSPIALVERVASWDASDPAWISLAPPEDIARQVQELGERVRAQGGTRDGLPLYGIPFAVKDNIDVARFETTAGCPAFTRMVTEDATVVARLRAAGAIVVGKTNMDQFATGLTGTRSPYGAVPSVFDAERIGGGSSSGSAAVVARGLVPFALGTDTAGSGRVPAGFQNIVGWKPTRGRLSTHGVVPACRTLDCVSIFALTVADAAAVARALDAFDPRDPYARRMRGTDPVALPPTPRLAVPGELDFDGDGAAQDAFARTLSVFEDMGCTLSPIDFTPFAALAELLYASPWVVERRLVAREVLARDPVGMDPVVHGILERACGYDAEEAFVAEYRRAELSRDIDAMLADVDAMLVPTVPASYRLADIATDPLGKNARLGTYTNFANLADLCALSVPGCFRVDGLPAGVTLLASAGQEYALAALAARLQRRLDLPLGATRRRPSELPTVSGPEPVPQGFVDVAVLGAHLSGMPLNGQLTSRGAIFVEETRTAPRYRLYALPCTQPEKPGIARVDTGGTAIALEVWRMPASQLGGFVAAIPAPLGIGRLELADGRWVSGFICEPWGLRGARDISAYGGFRAYITQRTQPRLRG